MSRGLRIGIRVLLCAGALALGGAVALATAPPPHRRMHEVVSAPEDVLPPPPFDASLASRAKWEEYRRPIGDLDRPSDSFGRDLANGMIVSGGTPHRLILFSFDDGPDHRYTEKLLDTLDRLDVRALFFLTARRFQGHTPRERVLANIAQDIVRRGHIVGSHTLDHLQLPLLSTAEVEEQVIGTEEVFERVLGQRPFLIRPPGGARSSRIDAWLAQRGYTQFLWNLGTGDYQVRTSEEVLEIFRRVLARREREYGERGGIVLLHDIHEWSVGAMPRMVDWLEAKNCELLERNEELYDFRVDPRVFFMARDGASAGEVAPPAMPDEQWFDARQATLRDAASERCRSRLAMR